MENYARLCTLGINVAQNMDGENAIYWLASRRVYVYSSSVDFGIRYVSSDGVWRSYNLWRVYSISADCDRHCYGVRPVVTLKSGVQLVGEGSIDNPCSLQ